MPKKKGKKEGYSDKGQRSIVQQALYDVSVQQELLDKIAKDAKHQKFLTPYMVHERYGVSITTARKVLRMLAEQGVLKLYMPGRRTPIYVPAEKK